VASPEINTEMQSLEQRMQR